MSFKTVDDMYKTIDGVKMIELSVHYHAPDYWVSSFVSSTPNGGRLIWSRPFFEKFDDMLFAFEIDYAQAMRDFKTPTEKVKPLDGHTLSKTRVKELPPLENTPVVEEDDFLNDGIQVEEEDDSDFL